MSHKKKILFVEDDRHILKFAVTFLNNHFDVTEVTDGGKAWDCLIKESFSCVVLDIEIPVISGIEILKRMRKAGIDTPVIVVTGKSNLEYAERCADLGVGGYVIKPFSVVELKKRIDDLTKERLLSVTVFENEDKKLHPKISEAIDFISGNHHLSICVEDLAHTLDISYEHFIRIFKKELGMTPVEYINQTKINSSMKYLRETSLSTRESCAI